MPLDEIKTILEWPNSNANKMFKCFWNWPICINHSPGDLHER